MICGYDKNGKPFGNLEEPSAIHPRLPSAHDADPQGNHTLA